MNFDTAARRVVQLDDMIALIAPHDPVFVARKLHPRRARAWATFVKKLRRGLPDAELREIFTLITRPAGCGNDGALK